MDLHHLKSFLSGVEVGNVTGDGGRYRIPPRGSVGVTGCRTRSTEFVGSCSLQSQKFVASTADYRSDGHHDKPVPADFKCGRVTPRRQKQHDNKTNPLNWLLVHPAVKPRVEIFGGYLFNGIIGAVQAGSDSYDTALRPPPLPCGTDATRHSDHFLAFFANCRRISGSIVRPNGLCCSGFFNVGGVKLSISSAMKRIVSRTNAELRAR